MRKNTVHGTTKTESQVLAEILAGGLILIGEYRLNKAEAVDYTDKETKKPEVFKSCRHTVEIGPTAYTVNENIPDDFEPAQYVSPFKKGERVALYFNLMTPVKGGTPKFFGELVHIVADKTKGAASV